MNDKVVLLDLEHNLPSVKFYRDILEHYATIYIFSRAGSFEFPLLDLTEFCSWVASGQVVILDTLQATEQEYEYAVIVGQLIALISAESHVEVVSAAEGSQILSDMLTASGFSSRLIKVEIQQAQVASEQDSTEASISSTFSMPSLSAILANPQLQLIKKYCDVMLNSSGKPNSISKLKNSIMNILQLDAAQSKRVLGMLIKLKIIKRNDDQVSFRKKVLKQWQQLDLNASAKNTATDASISAEAKLQQVDALLAKLQSSSKQLIEEVEQNQLKTTLEHAQSDLHRNFDKIDPVQMEVIHKLNQMKAGKPKDIYALRDLLEELFPKSDTRLLLKEMIDKGYIYWNGHDVIYSHEMFLN